MIAQSLVDEARRLLAEGRLSQRKIAKKIGISRGTIGAIAAGRRPDYPPRRAAVGFEGFEPAGPPERCPGCGGMVFMPCRACLTRARREDPPAQRPRTPSRNGSTPEEPLSVDAAGVAPLELKPHHRARYEQVRARRREIERCLERIALE